MKKYIFLVLMIFGIMLPVISFAGMPDFNGPFVICGTSTTDPCTLCDIFKTAQLIVDTVIGFLVIFAVPILLAVGGAMILLYGADPNLLSKAKTIIKNAIIGLIIALLSWTLVNMVFLALTSDDNDKGPGKIFNAPWNEIKCEGGGINEDVASSSSQGEYCVCEIPVYDLNPSTYSSSAKEFAKNVKSSKLDSTEDCNNKCNISNQGLYCPLKQDGITDDKINFKCVTESYVKNTTVSLLTHPIDQTDSVWYEIGCFASEEECEKATEIGDTNFESCGRQCYMFGINWCKRSWAGAGDGICTKKGCSTEKPYMLERFRNEHLDGTRTLLDCSFNSASQYCRLGGVFTGVTKCNETGINTPQWCKRSAPTGSDRWVLSGIKKEQKGDASPALKDFLNCMYSKNLSGLVITSISDDKLCSGECDPSTGTNCSHHANSCHYGGASGLGVSRAVDFALGSSFATCSNIKKIAQECGDLYANGDVWINYETNHLHISVMRSGYNCNESGTPINCPSE